MSEDNYYGLWDTTPAPTKSGQSEESDPSIPDGEHRAVISNFECFVSKAGDVWMKWYFSIWGGMYDGRPLVKLSAPLGKQTDDEDYRAKQIGWAKGDLFTVLGEIPPVMGGILDPETRTTGPVITRVLNAVVSIAKKTTKGRDGEDRIRVYINELISAPETGEAPVASEEKPQDDFPSTNFLPEVRPMGDEDEIPF
jgi:hypothetical protein